jgi:hypothetical protein
MLASSRRFIQLFAREVGMSPKLFCVSCVFGKLLKQCDRAPCQIGGEWRWIVGITTNRI